MTCPTLCSSTCPRCGRVWRMCRASCPLMARRRRGPAGGTLCALLAYGVHVARGRAAAP